MVLTDSLFNNLAKIETAVVFGSIIFLPRAMHSQIGNLSQFGISFCTNMPITFVSSALDSYESFR